MRPDRSGAASRARQNCRRRYAGSFQTSTRGAISTVLVPGLIIRAATAAGSRLMWAMNRIVRLPRRSRTSRIIRAAADARAEPAWRRGKLAGGSRITSAVKLRRGRRVRQNETDRRPNCRRPPEGAASWRRRELAMRAHSERVKLNSQLPPVARGGGRSRTGPTAYSDVAAGPEQGRIAIEDRLLKRAMRSVETTKSIESDGIYEFERGAVS